VVADTSRAVICSRYRKIARRKIVCSPNANSQPSDPVAATSAAETATTMAITSE
jgi:hypothetical protein